jgi:hypothetical protein
MTKYSRFDPRNKKSGKHKRLSINKDIRIKEDKIFTKKMNDRMIKEVMYDENADWSDTYLEESVGSNRQFP